MARSRYKIGQEGYPHFLTCTLVEWIPLFEDKAIISIILDSFRFLQSNNRLTIYAYVIMKDHLHLVAAAEKLSDEMHDFKSYTAHEIVEYLNSKKDTSTLQQLKTAKAKHKRGWTYQVWQEGSHPQEIDSDRMMNQKVDYIHWNPVEKGYVEDPVDWKYSSASNYELGTGVLDVCVEW